MVVREVAGDALGSVTERFEVPPPASLHLSTPILTDRVAPATDRRSPPTPALAVHRTFAPQGSLYCQFEVFGAGRSPASGLPEIAAGLELRRDDGRVIRKVAPTHIAPDASGRVVRLLGMRLEGLEDGPYQLVLEAQDQSSGARLERREPFTLSRE